MSFLSKVLETTAVHLVAGATTRVTRDSLDKANKWVVEKYKNYKNTSPPSTATREPGLIEEADELSSPAHNALNELRTRKKDKPKD